MISNFQYVWGDTPWIQFEDSMYRHLQASGFSLTVGGDFVPMVLVGGRTPTIGVKGKILLPHYHRGKGNNLRYHRPWELDSNGKRKF